MMDCTDARQLLPLAARLERELDAPERQALNLHLENCCDCAALFTTERGTDQALAQAMQAVPVPAGLRTRLLHKLPRPARPWLSLPRLAAAAALLLAIGLGTTWVLWPAPEFNFPEFLEEVDYRANASPDKVEAWFAEQGFTLIAPRQFNYDFLENFDLAPVQGRHVPRLLFLSRDGDTTNLAHVFVFTPKTFHLAADLPPRVPTSTHTVQLLRDDGTGCRYLTVFTGSSLDPFLQRGI